MVTERKSTTEVIIEKVICGGIAGSVAKTSIAPLDRVKILFQVNSPDYPYTGVWNTLVRIAKKERIHGLFKGNVSSVVRVFPYAAIQFISFDFFQRLFTPNPQDISLIGNFVAGAMAGTVSVIFTYPLDVTRARLAAQISPEKKHYNGILDAFRKMYYTEGGVKALYRGGGPTMLGILPYSGFNFFTYHSLKWYYLNRWTDESQISTIWRLIFGSFSGLLGQTLVYPFDVIRRRMQIDGMSSTNGVLTYQYSSTWSAVKHICKTEGWRALYRGLQINYVKAVPLVSVSFTVNDVLRQKFGIEENIKAKRKN